MNKIYSKLKQKTLPNHTILTFISNGSMFGRVTKKITALHGLYYPYLLCNSGDDRDSLIADINGENIHVLVEDEK